MSDQRTGGRGDQRGRAAGSKGGSGRFSPVSSHVSFPGMEEGLLTFWKEREVFKRSVERRTGQDRFTVFEGPPTANGSPGIHHVLSRVFKDIFPRYKTMQGFYSPRKGGWDTHGLAVELEVEKELGFQSKSQIEEFGVSKFNELCRESVFRYVKEWEALTERVGFWIDLENAYVTYDNDYIETGWWIVKTLWDAGLVYQGRRVAPHCPRCGTTLSSHEVAQGYKDDTPDPSIYVKFEVDPSSVPGPLAQHFRERSYLLAWTTTPWTLPGNTALSVSAEDEYALVQLTESGERLVLAKPLMEQAIREEHTTLAQFKGSELVGLRYLPLYNPFDFGAEVHRFSEPGMNVLDRVTKGPERLTYPVITAEYVSMKDGTGIVHTAPPFGEDDYNSGSANGLYFVQPVDLGGSFVGSYPFAGRFVKNADPMIINGLKERGLLYRRETIKHTYPFCWRCDSPLLYYAKSSWYLKTSSLKDNLLSTNEEINWYPEHIKNGRFGEWLRGNVDWAISRERYWGTPWPVWECSGCHHQEAVGSRAELLGKASVSGMTEDMDLHRPFIDEVAFDCSECGAAMRRLPDVMDGWFDSGAMPWAQWHYPFENRDLVEGGSWYPADFICEAIDQTRGWFYTLHAVANLMEAATEGPVKAPSFRNVISLGLILDGKGEKMSKSRGNAVDPWEVINAHGADALRWYLYSASPAGDNRRFSTDLVGEAVRKFLLTLWNTYSFFVTYANIDGFDPASHPASKPVAELDRWVLSRLNLLVGEVTASLDDFDATTASRRIQAFVDDLSNWYVRRSRRRFWKSENDDDKASAYATLYECLVTLSRLLAPFTPFLAEEMYRNLVTSVDSDAPESVHLTDFPVADQAMVDEEVAKATDLVIKTVSLGRAARNKSKIRVRQPLQQVLVVTTGQADRDALSRMAAHVREELNVKEVAFVDDESSLVELQVKPKLALLGPKYGPELGKVTAALERADPKAVVAKVRAGASVEIGDYTLEADDIEVAAVDKPGFAAASEGSFIVAVTTEVTPELALEGKARELVHRIQNMRKAAGFDIADRIELTYQGGDEIAEVFAAHAAYIQQEVLAVSVAREAPPDGAHAESMKVDGAEVELGVRRVGT